MTKIENIAADILECAKKWEAGARLLGNVTASEIAKVAEFAMWASSSTCLSTFSGYFERRDSLDIELAQQARGERGNKDKLKVDKSHSSEAARILGSKGGKTAAAKMTKAQRKERAQAAAKARWAKRDEQK